jgi:2-isopropylmalate synthase
MKQELIEKYRPYPPVEIANRTWPDKRIEKAPTWCSVDLRDGNQALIQPMSLEKKREMFDLLVSIGFREIEVGFPSASEVEFDFTRVLIEEDLIPEGTFIQVLTQAREHLIRKTFESVKGAREAIIHLYNSTSTLQRKTVFRMSRKEIVDLAVNGAKFLKEEEPI